jgi:hypothetical protein
MAAQDLKRNLKKHSQIIGSLGLSVLAIVFYGVVLGWRGVAESGVAWVDLIAAANQAALSDKPWSVATPHPGLDLLGIPLLAIGEGARLEVLGWVSIVCTGLTVPAVWMLGHRLGREWGAIAACVLFLGLPAVTGAATTTSPAAVVLLLWTWFFALSTSPDLGWRGWLVVGLLAALLAVSWLPILLWLVIWLVLRILHGATDADHESQSPGMIPGAALSPGVLTTVLAGVAALLFVVQLGAGDLARGFDTMVRQGLLPQTEAIVFAGETYARSRPPLVAGAVWWLIQTPGVFVILALVGFVGGTRWGRERLDALIPSHVEQGFPLGLVPLALVWLWGMPWLLRARTFGGVDPVLLSQPIMAALAGAALTWIIAGLVERLRDAWSARALAVAAAILGAVAFLPGLVNSARLHPLQSAHYNAFIGGTEGAIDAGFPAFVDDTLPLKVAERLAESAGAQPVDAGGYEPHLSALVRDRIVSPIALVEQNQQPALMLRAITPNAPAPPRSPFKRIKWSAGGTVVFEVLVLDPPPAD